MVFKIPFFKDFFNIFGYFKILLDRWPEKVKIVPLQSSQSGIKFLLFISLSVIQISKNHFTGENFEVIEGNYHT